MLKLIRNTLGDWGVIYTNKCEAIQWNYFKSLVDLLERGGLHLATKICRRHINYKKEKMKVRLAVQTFSTSVADALTYCFIKKYPNFTFCNITAEFCRRGNDIFDLLNTRNFWSKVKCKRPLFLENEIEAKEFITSSINYLKSLKDKNKLPITRSQRKTGFNGLIICLMSE